MYNMYVIYIYIYVYIYTPYIDIYSWGIVLWLSTMDPNWDAHPSITAVSNGYIRRYINGGISGYVLGISYIKGDISMGIFYMPFLSLNLLLSQKWSRKNDPAAEDSIFEPQKQFQCW